MITREQLKKGCLNYVDREVIPHLPTAGKWVMGAAAIIVVQNADNMLNNVLSNPILKQMNIISSEGLVDEEMLLSAIKTSADKYGRMEVNVPLVGLLSFTSDDVNKLKNYIQEDYV